MPDKPTWAECHAAGMTNSEAARARGVSKPAASQAAKRGGWKWWYDADAQRERIKRVHANPAFNPLVLLTPKQRENYDLLLHVGGLKRAEALRAVGAVALLTCN